MEMKLGEIIYLFEMEYLTSRHSTQKGNYFLEIIPSYFSYIASAELYTLYTQAPILSVQTPIFCFEPKVFLKLD